MSNNKTKNNKSLIHTFSLNRLLHKSPFWSLIFWAGVWELVGQMKWMTLLPPLSGIWFAFAELFGQSAFWDALIMTARTFSIGLGLSIIVGIPIGILMGISQRADKILSLWVNLFLSAPITAVIPALMPILGIGDATVIATVILFAIWVVIIDTQAGVTQVKDSLVENLITQYKSNCKRSFGKEYNEVINDLRKNNKIRGAFCNLMPSAEIAGIIKEVLPIVQDSLQVPRYMIRIRLMCDTLIAPKNETIYKERWLSEYDDALRFHRDFDGLRFLNRHTRGLC